MTKTAIAIAAFTAVLPAGTAFAQTGAVNGLVRSAGDGAALPGVEISLAGTRSDEEGEAYAESIRSGADGRFLFADLPLGEYVLGLSKSGYEAGVRVSRSVEIEADGEQVDLVIELRRSAAVAGRVVDPDGDPVSAASVFAAEWDTARGRRSLRQIESARTDDRGEFRLHGLRAGPYVIGVHPMQLPAPPGVLAFDLAPQYYPNATMAAGAVPLRLAWGEERLGLEFQLEWSPRTALEGSVQQADGSACGDCVVTGTNDVSPTPVFAGVNRQGLFAIRGAPPGEYSLLAQRRRERMFDHAEVVLVDGSPTRAALRLSPGLTVGGRIVYDQAPREAPEAPPTVELTPLMRNYGNRGLRAEVDAAGAFALEGVAPGRYAVSLRGQPAEAYLDQVLVGGAPAPRREIVVGSGIPAVDVQLRVATDGGTVEGRVVAEGGDGVEAPDGFAVLLPAGYETGDIELTAAYRQSDGLFRFIGAPPGRYHLFAVSRGNHFDLGAEEDRAYLRRQGKALRVSPGQTLQLEAPFVGDP